MNFSSLIFLIAFLPFSIIGYFLITPKLKNIFLLIISLFFYSWGSLETIPILLGSILVNYIFALLIEKTFQKKALCKLLVILMLAINIALLFSFKYLSKCIAFCNHFLPNKIYEPRWSLPLGISFFTFSAISYVLDVYFKSTKAEKNIINIALYISFFPKLISGPIIQWSTFQKQLTENKTNIILFSEGLQRLIVGLAKKVIIADTLGVLSDIVFNANDFSSISVLLAWLGCISYCLQIYFDFSGYSDMAVGIGKLFGFNFDENFNYPYRSKNITEFWGKRWHITLGTWINHYIYTPLFRTLSRKNPYTGKKRSTRYCDCIALLISWCIIGPWHGANFTYLVYGLYFFIFIFLERLYENYKKQRKKNGVPIKTNVFTTEFLPHIYVSLVIIFGFMVFRANTIQRALHYFMCMFKGTGNNLMNDIDTFYFSQYWFLIAVGIIFSLPVIPAINEKIIEKYIPMQIHEVLKKIMHLILLIISIAFAIGNSYKAFIYFNF